jgi:hypothetical protein
MNLNKLAAIPAIALAAGIGLTACGSAGAATAPASQGYTDVTDCTTLAQAIATVEGSMTEQNVISLAKDLTADASSGTESPALTAATTTLSNDFNGSIAAGTVSVASEAQADEPTVATACAAAGVTLPSPDGLDE